MLDRGDTGEAVLYAVSLTTGTPRIISNTLDFDQPESINWGAKKRIYVGDRYRIHRVNPYDNPAAAPGSITHPYIVRIVDIVRDGQGGFYLIDRASDPLGEGYRGAILHLDPTDDEITLVASSPLFGSPRRAVLTEDGSLLLLDPAGRMSSTSSVSGAIMRIDPVSHEVTPLMPLSSFTADAQSLERLEDGSLLLVDSNISVPGMSPAGGALLRLSPAGSDSFVVTDTLAIDGFGDPTDLTLLPNGNVMVLDRRPQIDEMPEAEGALFQLTLGGELVGDPITSSLFIDLQSVDVLGGPDIDQSVFQLTDVNRPPIRPGDVLSFHGTIVNSGPAPTGVLKLTVIFDLMTCLMGSAAADSGSLSYDPLANAMIWTGEVEAFSEVSIGVDAKVPDTIPPGAAINTTNIVSGNEVHQVMNNWPLEVTAATADGMLIYVDPGILDSPTSTTPRVFTINASGTATETLFWDPEVLPYPIDLTFGPDGRLYVLDGEPGYGKIFAMDPLSPDFGDIMYADDRLDNASGICMASDGNLLITDAKTRWTLGFNGPGRVYHFDLETQLLTRFFVDEENLLDPEHITPDWGGGYLVTDSGSNLWGDRTGALFRLDGEGNLIETVELSDWTTVFMDPSCSAVAGNRVFFVADARWDSDPRHGTVRRVQAIGSAWRSGPLVQASDSLLIEPWGLELIGENHLKVADRRSKPSGNLHALLNLQLIDLSWRLTVDLFSPTLVRPTRVATFKRADVELSAFEVVDLNGGEIVPGDQLQLTAEIVNHTPIPAIGVSARLTHQDFLTITAAEAESGEIFINDDYATLDWTGNLAFEKPVTLSITVAVDPLALNGDEIDLRLKISGFGSPQTGRFEDLVSGPLQGGEILVLDTEAIPFGSGEGAGGLFTITEAFDRLMPYRGSVGMERPVDLIPLAKDRVLILDADADPLEVGGDTGALLELNLESGLLLPVVADWLLVSPRRILTHASGDWLILDPEADLGYGDSKGVIYRANREDGITGTPTQAPDFRSITDLAFDDQGRIFVSDKTANPLGMTGNPGAIFLMEADPLDGHYVVIDTFQTETIHDPRGMLWIPGRGLLFCDPGWQDSFGHTGIRLLDPESGTIAPFSTSRYYTAPNALLQITDGSILVVDPYSNDLTSARGTVFRIDGENGQMLSYAAHASTWMPMAIATMPNSEPIITRFLALEDSSGFTVAAGDTLHCELAFSNRTEMVAEEAHLTLALSQHLLLDPASVVHTGGGALTSSTSGLTWTGSLTATDTVAVSYEVQVLSTPELSSWTEQELTIADVRGEPVSETLIHYISSTIGAGEMLIVDQMSTPRGADRGVGAVFRLEGPARRAVPVICDTTYGTLRDIALIPGRESELLLVDAGDETHLPGVLLGSTATGQVTMLGRDTTFASPRSIAVFDSATAYVLDEDADPLGLRPEDPPGAIYRLDIESGEVTFVFSDTVMIAAQDLAAHQASGVLVLLCRRGGEDPSAGGVFEINPLTGEHRTVRRGEPFRSPRCVGVDATGNYLVVDPAVQHGTIFTLQGNGEYSVRAMCIDLVNPLDMLSDAHGNPLMVDTHANPLLFPDMTGSIFRLTDETTPGCEVFLSGPPLLRPYGADVFYDDTPVHLAFNLTDSPAGVQIAWHPTGSFATADYYVYRRTIGDEVSTYALLNPVNPITGSGALSYLDADVLAQHTYEYVLLAVQRDGSSREFGPLRILVRNGGLRFGLDPLKPNPLLLPAPAEGIAVRFQTPVAGERVGLHLYDVTGRLVRSLLDEPLDAGTHLLLWDARDGSGAPVGSGVYFMRLRAGSRSQQRRVVFIR